MKYLLISVLFIPLFSFAQDCKIKKSSDAFTQEPLLSTGFMPFGGGMQQVQLSVDANKSEIDFFFSLSRDSRCFDNNSSAVIFFDGTKVKATYKNTGSMNCKGLFHFTFRNVATTPSALQRLSTQKISSIQLTGSDNAVTNITFSDEEKQLFSQMVTCLVTEAKTLIKK